MVVNLLSLKSQTITPSSMKYNEFFKLAKKNGWRLLRQGKGSHQIWEKENKDHGSKEMPKGLEKSLKKEMGL